MQKHPATSNNRVQQGKRPSSRSINRRFWGIARWVVGGCLCASPSAERALGIFPEECKEKGHQMSGIYTGIEMTSNVMMKVCGCAVSPTVWRRCERGAFRAAVANDTNAGVWSVVPPPQPPKVLGICLQASVLCGPQPTPTPLSHQSDFHITGFLCERGDGILDPRLVLGCEMDMEK